MEPWCTRKTTHWQGKLAKSLEIELPPDAPPGYEPPDFQANEPAAEPDQLSEATPQPEAKIEVEDFSAAGQDADDFALDPVSGSDAEDSAAQETTPEQEPSSESAPAADASDSEATENAEPTSHADSPVAAAEPSEEPSASEESIEPSDAADASARRG